MQIKNPMISFALPVLLAFSIPVYAADHLPIDHGRYVASQRACNDPKGSILFIYDGESIKSQKTTCTFKNVTGSGNFYRFDESCSYYSRWWSILPTAVNNFMTQIEVVNNREFVLKRENENLEFNEQYRWCSAE